MESHISLQSFSTHDPATGIPLMVQQDQRVRGGKGTLPERFPNWFVPADSDWSEVMQARLAAGLVY
jgi:hypothetical protein